MRAAHSFALFDAFAPLSDVQDLHASWDGSGVALTRGYRASPRRRTRPTMHRARVPRRLRRETRPRCVLLNAVFIKMKNSIQIEMEKDASEWTDAVSVASPCDFTHVTVVSFSTVISTAIRVEVVFIYRCCAVIAFTESNSHFYQFAHVHMRARTHATARPEIGTDLRPRDACRPPKHVQAIHPPRPCKYTHDTCR